MPFKMVNNEQFLNKIKEPQPTRNERIGALINDRF